MRGGTSGRGFMEKFARTLTFAAAACAALCLLGIMLLTFVDVLGRYFFGAALPFAVEIIELGMGLVVFLSLAMTTLEKGHISVDLVTTSLPAFAGRILAILAAILGTVFFGLLSWQLFIRASSFLDEGLATQVLFLKVYPVAFVMALAAVFVTMICLFQIFNPDHDSKQSGK